MNILLCITGSVAASVSDKTIEALEKVGNLKVAATEASKNFTNSKDIYYDEDEWKEWLGRESVLHIDLKNWADILVFAPLSANTLAKMANGLSDNLVTSIYRAWPMDKPIVIAPAMNTDMWVNPITQDHLNTLYKRHILNKSRQCNCTVVQPIEKTLVCGTTGIGAMAHIDQIADAVKDFSS